MLFRWKNFSLLSLIANRAHSAFRGPPVRTRLWRTHSVFRAYGGHTVPFAPTAGTQCLSRLRRSLRRQGKNFLTGGLRSASDLKKKSTEYRKGPSLGKTPGLGPRWLWGRCLPFPFKLADCHCTVLDRTCNVLRGRAASFAPTAATTEANRDWFVLCST